MFGERLKLARKKAGFSLRDLSKALDNRISAQAIGKYERGEMMPSSGILLALAKTLDVSLDYLMGDPGSQTRWGRVSQEIGDFCKRSRASGSRCH